MTARRTDHMEYMDGMEALDSDILNKVIHAMDHYDPNTFTETHVRTALSHDIRTPEDFAALLSPAQNLFWRMAQAAQAEQEALGNCINLFTPLYISNYCRKPLAFTVVLTAITIYAGQG